jgi:hypothetical protein
MLKITIKREYTTNHEVDAIPPILAIGPFRHSAAILAIQPFRHSLHHSAIPLAIPPFHHSTNKCIN